MEHFILLTTLQIYVLSISNLLLFAFMLVLWMHNIVAWSSY